MLYKGVKPVRMIPDTAPVPVYRHGKAHDMHSRKWILHPGRISDTEVVSQMLFSNQMDLNDGWKFRKTVLSGVEMPDFPDDGFKDVTLPHDWQIENRRDPGMEWGGTQGYYPRNETGWYRRRLDIPQAWYGKAVWLILDGCQRFYDVYLNGKRIGGRRYGYLPELIPLQNDLKYGMENLLAIRVNVDDTLGDRWYSGAGLYRGVRLLVKEPCHITPWSLKVQTDIQDTEAQVRVDADVARRISGVTAQVTLHDPEGKVAGRAMGQAEDGIHLSFSVPSPRLWDMDDPVLYTLEILLKRNGRVLDRAEEKIGFRTAVFDGDRGFILNGRVRKLYGANLHHDGGVIFGAAVPDEILRRRLTVLKEMGCNAVRCSHNPQSESFYDLCDELGLVVIDELYDKWYSLYFSRLFDQDRYADLSRMIARDRNHPCVILWSVGNEVEIQYTDLFYEKLREMVDACHALDPTRPVSLALIGFCLKGKFDDRTDMEVKMKAALRYADIVDVFMGNYMEGYYTALRNAGMRKAIIGSEVFTYYRNEECSSVQTVARSPWADVRDRDYVAGGFVWAGVDYLGEAGAWPARGWPGCPVDSTGFRKLRSWYLESQWKTAPVMKLGILDEGTYDDMARANWGFPLMRASWHARRQDLFQHVCVMTNCDEVRLYLNDQPVRKCSHVEPDGMMHFLVPYMPGVLRAEGFRGEEKVLEQMLHSSESFERIRAFCKDPVSRSGGTVQVDLELLDAYDQVWERTNPEFSVTLEGDCELLGIDHGDLLDEAAVPGKNCSRFHLGHAAVYIRLGNAPHFHLTVHCGNIQAEYRQ